MTQKSKELSVIRRWMQTGFVVLTLLIGLRHILPGESSKGGAFDSFCPFGAVETLWAYVTTGHPLKSTSPLNFTFGIAVLGVSLVAGRAFCSWMCPLGTLQDLLAGWSRRLSGEKHKKRGLKSKARFPINLPPAVDQPMRYLKYIVLAAIIVASAFTLYPPLHSICPARAIFGFHWDTLLLGVGVLFILSSMLIRRFSCKYLCPLGALVAITNKFSLIKPKINQENCTHCGRCDQECPMDIPTAPDNLNSMECIRCLECLETCARKDTVDLYIG